MPKGLSKERNDDIEVINLDKLEESAMCACKAGDDLPW